MKRSFVMPLVMILMVAVASWACSKYPGFKKTDSGLYYKLYEVSKDTVKPKQGFWVSINYRIEGVSKGKDTIVLNSKNSGQPPIRLQIPQSDYKGDIYEGMQMLAKGDSGIFIVNADSLFTKTFRQSARPPFLDSNTVVKFFIEMVEIENPAKLKEKEMTDLKDYIQKNNITAQPLESGVYLIEETAGNGPKIDSGDHVKLHFTVKLIDGKEVFSSKTRPEPFSFVYGERFDTPGLEQAIGMMTKGTKAKVIVPSSMGFGEQGRGTFVPAYATILYEVEILDIQSKAEFEKEQAEKKKKEDQEKANAKKNEVSNLQKYLKENNIKAKPTASGLYYIEKVAGTGPQAVSGKKVSVHYTGTLLNGTKFDSSRDRGQPFEFTLGNSEVIKGWDEGIAMMKKGGRATLIVPSSIAYGESSMASGAIPPYSTLVFDVELLDVK